MNARTSVFPAKAGTQNLSHKREVSQRPSAYAKNAERGLYPPPPFAAKTRFQLGRSLFVKGLGPRLRGEHGKKGNKAPIPGFAGTSPRGERSSAPNLPPLGEERVATKGTLFALPFHIPRRHRQFHVRRSQDRRGREPKGAEGHE